MRQIISTLRSAVIFTYCGVSAISTVLKTIILRSPSLRPSPPPPPPLYIIIPTTKLINSIECFFALLSKLYYCTFYIQYSSTFSTSSSLTSSTSTTSSTSLKSLTSTFLYLFSLLLCHPLPLLLLLLLPLIQRLFRSSKADHTKP